MARDKAANKMEFDGHIKELHKLGINPVTLPVNWKIEYLPCLFKLEKEE